MSYLSAEKAAKVRTLAGVVTERTPDGGLLMKRFRALAEILIEHVGDN